MTTDPTELHLLFILLDSNLPTGGFVSSSGLESWAKHGFLSNPTYSSSSTTQASSVTQSSSSSKSSYNSRPNQVQVIKAITDFARAEVESYSRTTGYFVRDAWKALDQISTMEMDICSKCGKSRKSSIINRKMAEEDVEKVSVEDVKIKVSVEDVVKVLVELDQYHESTLLSHVSRRSSKAQGIAMLTLHARGLSKPVRVDMDEDKDEDGNENKNEIQREREKDGRAREVVEGFKRCIRAGKSPGHLAVCWGVMCAALGLSLERTLHLHLFLHARSLLSSAVRLNLIGPYASSQLLLHPFESIISNNIPSSTDTTGILECRCVQLESVDKYASLDRDWDWDWAIDAEMGPATTWPLGEVLMARHDLQHSRIFNS
ncbi:hypothetical protein BCR39DRAFT_5952 [Naematelia encephala]|uniref:Uncharacterized protein n=1 Tax=Naematelia encephala TaxID=71784 RepID=A0A1Y2BKV6_9TREE|nr:hypothetical protein BCR39DRAFT_5952 [Naematelia encephala]